MTSDTAPAAATATSRSATARRLGQCVRNALVTLGITGALTLGAAAVPATASATEPTRATAGLVMAWCPFGTHSGPGGGCRGGSINDNQRLNDSLRNTGRMYVDAGECAGRAVGKSLWKNRKKLTLPSIGLGTVSPAIKCGRSKGY